MIDIQLSQPDALSRQRNPSWIKILAAVSAVLVLVGTVMVLWYFLSPTRTITISEGKSYGFSGYTLKVERITDQFCPGSSDVDCNFWLYEDGVQLSYSKQGSSGVYFEYLGVDSKNQLSLRGLDISLIHIDFEKQSVRLKLAKH